MGVMLENAAVQITLGSHYTGAAPVLTGPASDFLARAKTLSVTDEFQTTNVAGAGVVDVNGNPAVANRYHSGSQKLTLKGVVPATGFTFTGSGKKGFWIKVEVKETSSLANFEAYTGVITKWEASLDQGQPSMETIEVDLNADAIAAPAGN